MRYCDKLESSCLLHLEFETAGKATAAFCGRKESYDIVLRKYPYSQTSKVFLDAMKTFYKVAYHKLFQLLLERYIPLKIIRIMLNMYSDVKVLV